ncbi:MAG: hypothetical protein H6712_28015 [Myxococcales bacterium]|nr:hypothetical protein [Myxococcales bacterium]MCB9717727.1 hypothetical protein [Myxococcales bacterium]
MPATLGLLLSPHDARARRPPDERVGVVLVERTLFDPPRAAAAKRWAPQLRRAFPSARLVPYAWHLVSHGPEERMRERTTRTLSGPPHLFGGLQRSPQTEQAWEVTRLCAEAMEADAIVLRTPPSVTPGALGRGRIRAFVEARRAEGLGVIWEPEGLWEPLDAAALAKQCGATLLWPAFTGGRAIHEDGREGLVPAGAWLRVDGAGAKRGIHGGHVDELLDHLDLEPDATIVFAGPRARGNLGQLAEALAI